MRTIGEFWARMFKILVLYLSAVACIFGGSLLSVKIWGLGASLLLPGLAGFVWSIWTWTGVSKEQ